ncbi:MAG: FmdB family zinc ribbon protein [Burkholderiales bacterium]|nr:zinc ribbon domain-containing protein [Ferrovum sp.]
MPLYEYRCQACGKEIEVLQKISDAPRTECPSCGQSTLIKKVTAAGFQLKGTGWYVTDFRGGSSTTTAAAPKPEPAKTAETAPSASSDTKSAEPKPAKTPTPSVAS